MSLIAVTATVFAGNEPESSANERKLLFTVEFARHCERAPGKKYFFLDDVLAKDPANDAFLAPSECTKVGVEHHY